MAKVTLKHPTGVQKQVKVGFSWTIFFFGIIALLIRGQIKEALIVFFGSFVVGLGAIYLIYLWFKGNEKLREELLLKGFEVQA